MSRSHPSRIIEKSKAVKVPYKSVAISFFSSAPSTNSHIHTLHQQDVISLENKPTKHWVWFFFQHQIICFPSLLIDPVTNPSKRMVVAEVCRILGCFHEKKVQNQSDNSRKDKQGSIAHFMGLRNTLEAETIQRHYPLEWFFLQEILSFHWKTEGKIPLQKNLVTTAN